jgi:hypothetical protein
MRKKIEFDPKAVQATIYDLEKGGPWSNRGKLLASLAEHYGVSVATIAKWVVGMEITTPLGKRGGEGGDFGRSRGIKPDLSGRKARKGMRHQVTLNILGNLPSFIKPQVKEKVEKLCGLAELGNTKAMLQLKCLDCVLYQPNEMRGCTSESTCSIYPLRPYKGKLVAADEESGSFTTQLSE